MRLCLGGGGLYVCVLKLKKTIRRPMPRLVSYVRTYTHTEPLKLVTKTKTSLCAHTLMCACVCTQHTQC